MHEFIPISIDEMKKCISYSLYPGTHYDFAKICTKCNLIIANTHKDGLDFFFFNNKEIFRNWNYINEVNLTCEEFIIKNIIE